MRQARALPHAALGRLHDRDGVLVVGGRSLLDICAEAGGTPLYVYDTAEMTGRVKALRGVLPAAVHLHYAIKANPHPRVVAHFAGLVDGFDVASAGELVVALGSGMDPARISFAGPGKRRDELVAAARGGITVHVESEQEIAVLAQVAAELRCRPAIAIRVNPDFQLKTAGMKMGGGPAPFGIDAERVPDVLESLRGGPLDFRGFHIFAGSQNLSAAAIVEAQSSSVALAEQLAKHAPAPVRHLNIGGGFGIPYFPGEQPLDLSPIGDSLAALVRRCATSLPEAQLIIELGRYLVGEAGYYVCRVLDRKVSRGRVFLVTDGGLHHHLAASGNFGQVLRKNYPVVVGNRMRDEHREIASVVGPLCTPLDLLADAMELPVAAPGDLIVVLQSGAYGYSASPRGFLSHPEPREVVV